MNQNEIVNILFRKFGIVRVTGLEAYINCPFCHLRGLTPNTTYKLGIHLTKHVYHCFRCDAKGRLSYLIPQIPDEKIIQEPTKETDLERLPGPAIPLLQAPYPACEIIKRTLSAKNWEVSEIAKYSYFVEEYKKGEMNSGPRIIFPITMNGIYAGFQARTIYKDDRIKYISATGIKRNRVMWNYDRAFTQREQLVITEGFFDCIRTGLDDAVATLGKIITEAQLAIIKLADFKRVIIFLDPDAEKELYANADKLKLYVKTYIAHATAKDPGDMTTEEIRNLFKHRLERVY